MNSRAFVGSSTMSAGLMEQTTVWSSCRISAEIVADDGLVVVPEKQTMVWSRWRGTCKDSDEDSFCAPRTADGQSRELRSKSCKKKKWPEERKAETWNMMSRISYHNSSVIVLFLLAIP